MTMSTPTTRQLGGGLGISQHSSSNGQQRYQSQQHHYNNQYQHRQHGDTYDNYDQHSNSNGQLPSIQSQARHQPQQQQQQQQPTSTKALAITSKLTRGDPPPPLVGSAMVLVNDSALHCFGGRLENRELSNCHYILDVETGIWDTVKPAHPPPPPSMPGQGNGTDSTSLFSLSLSTDPTGPMTGSLSGALSLQPKERYFHTLNAYGTSLILFGGMAKVDGEENQAGLEALGDLHVFDIVTRRWQQKHPPVNAHTPKPRWAHMSTLLDHYLVIIGGTDSSKAYVEDVCVLDLQTWEWVSSVPGIGQCGSYRTVAATGPSQQSTSMATPSVPSFPATGPIASPTLQHSAHISWPSSMTGSVGSMASISMVLGGAMGSPTPSVSTNPSGDKREFGEDDVSSQQDGHSLHQLTSEAISIRSKESSSTARMISGELTPAFKAGSEAPAIYLYSNYNFQQLQRDFKVITPHYTQSHHHQQFPGPSFSIAEKSQALEMIANAGGGADQLPPGLRFPQGHVYQDRLILTGMQITSGKAPTLVVYALNLHTYKWEKLSTDGFLETGSWNRTVLHPSTGSLLVFGNQSSNAEADYTSRIQNFDHLIMINLQAYGLYQRPVPSMTAAAQDLGMDLLKDPCFNDMDIASVTGTLHPANSTLLAARWPDFAQLLLSPPYVTPLILELPVPAAVVDVFLQFLYTGAIPDASTIGCGLADYLLILAKRYQFQGLYALVMDTLHQNVVASPVRIYNSALMAGELGLQARAVGLAVANPSGMLAPSNSVSHGSNGNYLSPPPLVPQSSQRRSKQYFAPVPNRLSSSPSQPPTPPPPSAARRRPSVPVHPLDPTSAYRGHTRPGGYAPSVNAPSHHSRDSVSTDGGFNNGGDYYPSSSQYRQRDRSNTDPRMQVMADNESNYLSSPEPGQIPLPPVTRPSRRNRSEQGGAYYNNNGNGGGYIPQPPRQPPSSSQSQHSPYLTQQAIMNNNGYLASIRGSGSEGSPSLYGDEDETSSVKSSESRSQAAKRRLQQQMQMQLEFDQQQQQQQLQQQQMIQERQQRYRVQQQQQALQNQQQLSLQRQQQLLEEQHQRDQEAMFQEKHRLQLERYEQKQQRQQQEKREMQPLAMLGALDYHFGGNSSSGSKSNYSSKAIPSSNKSQKSNETRGSDHSRDREEHRSARDHYNNTQSNHSIMSNETSSSSSSKEKKGGLFGSGPSKKVKLPKPTTVNSLQGAADLMKSAGF